MTIYRGEGDPMKKTMDLEKWEEKQAQQITFTRTEWAECINKSWAEGREAALEAIFKVGKNLIAAKSKLEHSEFGIMIEDNLHFSRSTAFRLMAVASDNRLTNVAHAQHLPSSWMTLYELTQLNDDDFYQLIEDGVLCPEMERQTITAQFKKKKRADKERALAEVTQAISAEIGYRLYNVILVDPPWQFEVWSEKGLDRAADNHYPTMSIEEIFALNVPDGCADDCVLFLWATVPMLPEAMELMQNWGFTYKSNIAWVKDKIGTGYWVRNKHEHLLIGTKGDIPAPAPGTQPHSVVEAPVGKHSEKPEVFYEIIEKMFPTVPKLEMFARSNRADWDSWGNEMEGEL